MFTPSLPQNKILAIQTLAFPVVNKIFLTFEKEWWPKSANLHVIWTENDTKELKVSKHTYMRNNIFIYIK